MSALADVVRAFHETVEQLTARIRVLEVSERVEVAASVPAVAFADLPAAGQPGRERLVTNGRKTGEGAGAGTGVLAYDDGTNWLRTADDTVVAI